MSTHAIADEKIKAAWKAAWDSGELSDMLIEHENLRFTQPEGVPWGRLTLLTGTTASAAVGRGTGRMSRTPFILQLQVFIPENTGTRVAKRAVDAMGFLNLQQISQPGLSVTFDTAGSTATPNPANTGMSAFLVTINGQYDLTWVP